ncbi:hypothetical protein TNCV_1669811 [Trichonephila clavipes]|nr:hypothetical protein TNCV_1669811 [Trichonephila clavipes]
MPSRGVGVSVRRTVNSSSSRSFHNAISSSIICVSTACRRRLVTHVPSQLNPVELKVACAININMEECFSRYRSAVVTLLMASKPVKRPISPVWYGNYQNETSLWKIQNGPKNDGCAVPDFSCLVLVKRRSALLPNGYQTTK